MEHESLFIKILKLTLLLFPFLGCESYEEKIQHDKLSSVSIISKEGDDGFIVHNLEIFVVGNNYKVTEVIKTNFNNEIFSFLEVDHLSEFQINKVKSFLIEAQKKPNDCGNPSENSLRSKISIKYKDDETEINGFCDWNNNGYIDLRNTILGKETYPKSLDTFY